MVDNGFIFNELILLAHERLKNVYKTFWLFVFFK